MYINFSIISFILRYPYLSVVLIRGQILFKNSKITISSSAAEGGENAGGGKTEPQRQTESVAPPEDANEIVGGRTNAYKHSFQKRMLS